MYSGEANRIKNAFRTAHGNYTDNRMAWAILVIWKIILYITLAFITGGKQIVSWVAFE